MKITQRQGRFTTWFGISFDTDIYAQ